MASVVFRQTLVSLASNLSLVVAAQSTERSDSLAVPGEVRRMANGRLRVISRVGAASTLGVTMLLLTPPQVALLTSWVGSPVLLRDSRGRKLYGAYLSREVVDRPDQVSQNVSFVLQQISYSEAVV